MSKRLDVSRRALLRRIGVSVSLAAMGEGVLPAQDAQHVHNTVAAQQAKGPYKPKSLTAHEYATLRTLAEIVVPGARDARAAEFIDFLCAASPEMKEIYTGGLGWLDHTMQKRVQAGFAAAKPGDQTALLDLIAYRKNASPELDPGIEFFVWVRNMVTDAYYTSPVGMKELGFLGNGAMATFTVPKEAVEYALKRSPFA
jgi:gluconate 2-dehydrogenase gamma chain